VGGIVTELLAALAMTVAARSFRLETGGNSPAGNAAVASYGAKYPEISRIR